MRGVQYLPFILFIIVAGGCVSQQEFIKLKKDYDVRGEKLARLNQEIEVLSKKQTLTEYQRKQLEVLLKKREEELLWAKTAVKAVHENNNGWKEKLQQELSALKQSGISYNKKSGAIVMEDSVFFASGSATLKSDARAVLLKLARILKSKRGFIQVNGHTDSDKVVKAASKWPYGNMQLSGARAMHVCLFLRNEGGIDPKRMAFAGFGPHQPVAPNNTSANKSKNRRVEILLKNATSS